MVTSAHINHLEDFDVTLTGGGSGLLHGSGLGWRQRGKGFPCVGCSFTLQKIRTSIIIRY